MGAIRQGAGGETPRPAGVGRRRAEQRRAVVDVHRAVGRGRASQRQRVVIGDVVAHRAAVGRERRQWSALGQFNVMFTEEEAALVLPAASVSFAVKLWLPAGKAAVA